MLRLVLLVYMLFTKNTTDFNPSNHAHDFMCVISYTHYTICLRALSLVRNSHKTAVPHFHGKIQTLITLK